MRKQPRPNPRILKARQVHKERRQLAVRFQRAIRLEDLPYVERGRGPCEICKLPDQRRWSRIRWEGNKRRTMGAIIIGKMACAVCHVKERP